MELKHVVAGRSRVPAKNSLRTVLSANSCPACAASITGEEIGATLRHDPLPLYRSRPPLHLVRRLFEAKM